MGDPVRRLALLSAVAVVTAAVPAIAGSAPSSPPQSARSWIDAPLSGTVVVVAPVEVVAHATDPDGVQEVRLDVDGVMEASVIPEQVGATFVIARFVWTPTSDGLHRLDVQARDSAGGWGAAATTRVTVELAVTGPTTQPSTTIPTATTTTSTVPGPTTSRPPPTTTPRTTVPTPTTRPAPTTTTRPAPTTTTRPAPTTTVPATTTVCALGTPSPAGASRTDTLSPILSWSYRGCREPAQFLLQVSRDPGFARIEQSGAVSGSARSWTAGPLTDCITFYWRITTSDGGATGAWVSGGSFTIQTTRVCP
jgi:hypothetical protein